MMWVIYRANIRRSAIGIILGFAVYFRTPGIDQGTLLFFQIGDIQVYYHYSRITVRWWTSMFRRFSTRGVENASRPLDPLSF